jgi:hypothetical protein
MTQQLSESDLVKDATLQLRAKERSVLKKHAFGNYLTYWDADDLSLLLSGGHCVLRNTRFGQDVVISGQFEFKHPKLMTLHTSQIVDLQFANPEHIGAIMMVHKEFQGAELMEMSSPGLKDMEEYCVKMDQAVAETCKQLIEQKVKHPIEKIWKLMGGEVAPATDRLAKRMKYFMAITERYRQDKQKWRKEMQRLYLIK